MQALPPDQTRVIGLGFLAPVLAIGLAGCLLLVWATGARGLAVCPDGRTYLTGARLIAEGRGYSDFPHGDEWLEPEPVRQFPPLYPLLLALGHAAGLQGNSGARALQMLLYLGNVTLVACFVGSALRSRSGGWLAAALFAFAPPFMYVHLWVWSEPLCFFLMLSCLACLSRFETTARWRMLAWAVLFCGLALLTRFAAISLLLCGCGLLLVGRGELRTRVRNCACFGVPSILVLGAWILRNMLVADEATAFKFHTALMAGETESVLQTVAEWALPLPVWPGFKVAAFVVALVMAGIVFVRNARVPAEGRAAENRLVVMGGTLALVHFAFILAARRFVGTALLPNDRILGPMLLGLILLSIATTGGRGRYVLAALACVWLAGSVLYLVGVHDQGLVYMGANWR